jgi:hypothetical protein
MKLLFFGGGTWWWLASDHVFWVSGIRPWIGCSGTSLKYCASEVRAQWREWMAWDTNGRA